LKQQQQQLNLPKPIMLDRISVSDIPLFSRLSRAQLEQVSGLLRMATYEPGEVVVKEGAPAADLLYIIIQGEAALSKRGRYPLTDRPLDYEIAVRGKNEIFGWVPVLDGSPSPITVMARTPLTIGVLDLKKWGGLGSPSRHTRNVIIAELRHYSSRFVRTSIENRLAGLQHEAEFARYRAAVGSIVITALGLLSFYTLALSMLPRFETDLKVNFVLSPIIILFFAAFFLPVIRRSGLPPPFFGFCIDNWRAALPFAAVASLAFLAILVLVKLILIATVPQLHGLSLIGSADIRIGHQADTDTPWYWVALSLYLLLTPVQEFVARCGIQAPLYAFLQGSELKRAGLSIVISNLVFSAVHAHVGFVFALLAFVPGLIWGWIFLRTKLKHTSVSGAAVLNAHARGFPLAVESLSEGNRDTGAGNQGAGGDTVLALAQIDHHTQNALLLAYNWFGHSFFAASRRLRGETAGHFLRIFKHIERIDLAPPQREYVETMVEVRSVAVEQRRGAVPLRKHGGMPRPALHPDIVDLEMDIGQDAAEAFEPAAQGFLAVALAAKRVGAAKAVMDIRRDRFQHFIPAMVVDVFEGLPDSSFDNVAI
jgi:hypothetical protein